MKVTAVVRGMSVSGLAHQGRRPVAGAVSDIEAAGDFDLRMSSRVGTADPAEPLHRPVLRRGRIDQVDPERSLGRGRKVVRP